MVEWREVQGWSRIWFNADDTLCCSRLLGDIKPMQKPKPTLAILASIPAVVMTVYSGFIAGSVFQFPTPNGGFVSFSVVRPPAGPVVTALFLGIPCVLWVQYWISLLKFKKQTNGAVDATATANDAVWPPPPKS